MRIAPAVETVVMRGLMRDPTRRFPSVRDFATALREAVNQPVPAPAAVEDDETLLARARALFRRRRETS